MQKDWRLRQAQADYNANAGNDAAKQFGWFHTVANNYAGSPPNGTGHTPNPTDIGISNCAHVPVHRHDELAQNVWNREFAPGTTSTNSACGGVGWDGTITTTPASSAPGSVWLTSLSGNTTTANDNRISGGRILFLTVLSPGNTSR